MVHRLKQKKIIGRWKTEYNTIRPHSLLNCISMKYVKEFKNYYFRIKINTNSSYIYKLIKNFMDFGDTYHKHVKIRIRLDIYLHKEDKKINTENVFYRKLYLNENIKGWEFFEKGTAKIAINCKLNLVFVFINHVEKKEKEALLDFIFMWPIRFILAQQGLFPLHASVVCKNGDCLIINGPQNSGKSTLALMFCQNGFTYLSDDDCFVRNTGSLIPFPTKAGLTSKSITKFSLLKKYVIKNYLYGKKQRISLSRFFSPANLKTYKCKVLLFPRYKTHAKISLYPLSKNEALNRMIQENSSAYYNRGYKKIFVDNFQALYEIVRKVRAFELIYNDRRLNEVPSVIEKVF